MPYQYDIVTITSRHLLQMTVEKSNGDIYSAVSIFDIAFHLFLLDWKFIF